VDTIKSSKCYLELYSLRHRQPIKDITKDRSDMVKFAGTNNETGGGTGIKHKLKSADSGRLVLMRRIEWRYKSQPE